MIVLMATCEVYYTGRLDTYLPEAIRTICIKADKTILVQSDSGHKALNWMGTHPKSTLEISPDSIVATKGKEQLIIMLHKTWTRTEMDLGPEPGLIKIGGEVEIQRYLAEQPHLLGEGMGLVQREYPTMVGPVDLLCRDKHGEMVVVEVKRIGHINGVDQLRRYIQALESDPSIGTCRGLYAAPYFRPNALEYAAMHNIEVVRVAWVSVRDGVVVPLLPPGHCA